jgi:hypothetical protein
MQALGSEHMALDQMEERHNGKGSVTNLIGQRRQRQIDPLALQARTLAVERYVHAELVEQDRRQQLRADEAARRGMERRRRLGDPLAITAGELLAHRLNDLEATRDLLQRLGHILANLRQPRSAATGAARRSLDDDALVFDVVRPGLANRPLAREGAHGLSLRRCGLCGKLVLARRGDEFFELQFQLLDQPRRALGARPVQFAFELLDPQLEMRDQRLIVRQLRPRVSRFGFPIDGFGLYLGDLRRGRIAFDLDPQPRFTFSPQRLTFDQQRRLGAGKIRRKIIRLQTHEASESDFSGGSIAKCYPTRVGRKVS